MDRLHLQPPPQVLTWEVLVPGGPSQDTHPPWSSMKPLGEGIAVGSAFTHLFRVSSTIAFNSLTPPDLTSTPPPPCSPPSSQTGLLVVGQSLSHVRLFVTPWTAACRDSLSFTISQSLFKLMSIVSMMPSNHLIFCCSLLLPSVFSTSGSFNPHQNPDSSLLITLIR